MSRTILAATGAVVALGFLGASAVANYLFGASLGRSAWEAKLYGGVGVLAVAMNALAPFYLSWSVAASRRTTVAAIALMWALCLLYSLTSALGFAAQNREGTGLVQQISRDAYDDTRRELLDLETRRKSARGSDKERLERSIDETRVRLTRLRGQGISPPDAQSAFLASLLLGLFDPHQIRQALAALFAVMVEVCATLCLFAAISPVAEKPSAEPLRSRWSA